MQTNDDLVFETSRWQRLLYELERDVQPGLQKAEEKGAQRAARFADYQRELFGRFYNPGTKKLEKPVEGAEWAAELHQMAEEVAEFRVLQERTKGDEMWAGMATSTVNNSVVAKMKAQKSNEDIEGLRQRVDTLVEMGKQGIKVGGRLAKAQGRLKKAKANADAMAKGLDPAQLRNAIRKGCERAQDDIDEAEQMISAFSYGDQAGVPGSRANMAEKRELAKRVKGNRKLRHIAQLAGRLRIVAAEKQRSKTNYARDEVTSVEQGSDIDRLLPTELALLASGDESLELLFYGRLAERKCLQYKLSGREAEGRGPVVILMDESTSMEGDPEVFSKAVSMALLDVCQRQKRSWCFVHFNREVARVDVVKSGEVDSAELMECMQHFTGGGTSFEAALTKGAELIEQEGGFKKADILLVTDGYCQTSAKFNQEFAAKVEALDATVFTVLVNNVQAGESVAQWSDHIYTLADILDGPESGAFEDAMFSI